ncbi:MAG: CoA transferase [Proteobacteria bacterium]|nr:CoA transferase [Pseudomonadota bacterium]
MTALARGAEALAAAVEAEAAGLGSPVRIDRRAVMDRSGWVALKRPGLWSPNRSCRLVRAADGWIAVNLPRDSDLEAVPAWLGAPVGADPWRTIRRVAASTPWRRLIGQARLLALPICGVGEVRAAAPSARFFRMAPGPARSKPTGRRPVVLDLSSLWAGPLCGAILAEAGCAVTKLESARRPDVMRQSAPGFFAALNGRKGEARLDLADPAGEARLGEMMAASDVVITSARPRAFAQFGLPPQVVFARNPSLVWVAISGYGWRGAAGERVAFGDDAAAAGGLVRWTAAGEPRFAGDALADPLTGLAAAAGALKALRRGGGLLVDAAMARTAAGVAALGAAT